MHDGSVSRAVLYRLCAIRLWRRCNGRGKDNAETQSTLRCAEKKHERAEGNHCIAKKLRAASPCFSMRVRLNWPDSGRAKFQRCSTITIAPVRSNGDPPRKRNTRAYCSASA